MKNKTFILLFVLCIFVLLFALTGCTCFFGCVFGGWTTTKEATCTQKGEEQRVCVNDSTHVERRNIDMLPHTAGAEVKENEKLSTCIKEGGYDIVVRCVACNKELSRTNIALPKAEHTPSSEWEISEAATCFDNGIEVKKCSVCSKVVDSRVIPNLGHSYSEQWKTEINPTCTTVGSKYHSCVRCGAKKDLTGIPALGHSYGQWQMTKQPTINSMGTLKRVCSRDYTHVETFSLPALDDVHYVYTTLKEATCTKKVKSNMCTKKMAVNSR